MTRNQFVEEINGWDDLIDFCRENNYEDAVEDIYDECTRDDLINSELVERARNADWEELKNWLDDIPTGSYWYRADYYGWQSLDDGYDFDCAKDELLDRLDRDGFWEDEFEEELEEEDEEGDEDEDSKEENVTELLVVCSSTLQNLKHEISNEESDPLDDFYSKLVVTEGSNLK